MFPRECSKAIPPFHREIYSVLQDESIKRRAIRAPRGHAKSSLGSVFYPAWRLCYANPEDPRYTVLVSESQEQAVNFLTNIKTNLESNARLYQVFGDLVGPIWTRDDIVTANNVRVKAIGSGQKIRGTNHLSKRPTDIILDDFESELNTLTAENRAKNQDWVAGAVEPSLDDEGILTVIGTIIHQDSYLYKLKDDPSFRVLHYQALQEDGTALWPERFPVERLVAIRESLKARGLGHMFYQEYQNIARNMDEQAFNPADFRYYEGNIIRKADGPYIQLNQADGSILEKPVNVIVGVDLAISSRGDFTVILPLAVDADENLYVGDYFRARVEPDAIIETLFEFRSRFAPMLFVIETTAYQQAIITFLRKAMRERNTYFGVREVKPRVAKDVRLMGLQPFVKANRLYMKHSQVALYNELVDFPKSGNDDVIDALHNAAMHATKSHRNGSESIAWGEQFAPDSWRVL